MNTYQSTRVTFVPKPTKYRTQLKVEPVRSQPHCEDTGTSPSLSSHIHLWTTSMNSFQQPLTSKSMKRLIENKTHRSKEFLLNSSTYFDMVQQTMKNTSKDIRRKNKDKKKKYSKLCRITIIIIVILLILSVIAVGIYLSIRFTTNKNSTKTLNPVLRWNSTSITVAGLNNAPGVNASQLYTPTDVALDPFNTLYIPDFINNRVQKWLIGASSGTTVTGQVNATLSNTTGYLNRPAGIYIDSNDNIFVSDSNNHEIQLWANGALVGTLIAGTGRLDR
ncbi:unnamed protein product [Rotaria sp. Silwood2]|nr:unnamed protein product [Rotaria sp. Silwood2]CAF4503785.1 unnamed protein product [Rotaria sp. Silwood2]